MHNEVGQMLPYKILHHKARLTRLLAQDEVKVQKPVPGP